MIDRPHARAVESVPNSPKFKDGRDFAAFRGRPSITGVS